MGLETIEEMLAAEMASEEGDDQSDVDTDSDAEVGPGNDDDETAAPQGESNLDDDEPGDADDEGDEEDGDEEGADGEAEEGELEEEDSEGDPDDEKAPEPESTELAALRAQIERQEHELRLMRGEQEQRQQKPAKPPASQPDPQLAEAIKTAFYGGEAAAEALAKFPPQVRAEAVKRARRANELEVLKAVNPEAHYHETIGKFVDGHIRHLTRELVESREESRVDQAIAPYKDFLAQPGVEARVTQELRGLPKGGSFKDRLSLAVRLVKGESGSGERARTSQRTKTRKRDADAQRNAKRRRGRGKSRSRGNPKLPEFDDNNMHDYLEGLQALEAKGQLG